MLERIFKRISALKIHSSVFYKKIRSSVFLSVLMHLKNTQVYFIKKIHSSVFLSVLVHLKYTQVNFIKNTLKCIF